MLTAADLGRALTAVDPAALLVAPRVLRRIIKKDAGLTGPGLQVPHRKSYVIGRDALLAVADWADVGVPPGRELPETLLLFPGPDPRKLRALPPAATLLKYWRLLFHARVHRAVARALPAGTAGETVVRERIRALGQAGADEIRAVLRQENFLLHSHDLRSVYDEFVAVFLELRFFAPHRLAAYFPAVQNIDAVFGVLDAELDATTLFAATRLAGAADPMAASPQAEEGEAHVGPAGPPPYRCDAAACAGLGRSAEAAEKRGNLVRAALLRRRAAGFAPPGEAAAARAAAEATAERVAARLQAALELPESEMAVWRRGLTLLAAPAASGFWTREARLLYDLQRACIDQEHDVYAVDLAEWLASWGRRPVVRPVPHQRQVGLVRRLRVAANRLAAARIPEADRAALLDRLHAAAVRHEAAMRERFRPLMRGSLEDAGLRPRNFAEQVSAEKVVEELLDRAADRGFLTLGDLRDALARNRLKLPDLSGPREFLVGDPLLRANRNLAVSLDGVCRRGEIYLRGLQRLSSLAFGTPVGRFLTLYLILPAGGAFVALEGLQHVCHWVRLHVELVNAYSLPVMAVFLLLILHFSGFRRFVVGACRLVWAAVRGVCYDLPAAFLRLPPVRAVLQSRAYLLLYLFLLKPLPWAALAAGVLYLLGAGPPWMLGAGAAGFVAAELLLHSRLGLHLEEAFGDAVLRGWRLVSRDVVPGLFRLVLAYFRRLVDGVERMLYTVDEWLRFRGGDGRRSLVFKAALGLVWFGVTYVVRFCVNLLIEPQINPIKHFPVVTVSHKLVLAFFVPPATAALALVMNPAAAGAIALTVGFCIPGIFGFLVWEFKENWRLYRANAPRDLRPQTVGGHGETVARLLRPGFHSGTLPKVYARLRRAKGAAAGKRREELHHVEEAVRRFVSRNLLAMLAGSKAWAGGAPHVGRVRLASNRIRVELIGEGGAEGGFFIDLTEHGGRLVAGIAAAPAPSLSTLAPRVGEDSAGAHGWLDRLPPEPLRAFADALAGFYKAAGVDVVHEQAEALLPAGAWMSFDDRGLVVEMPPAFEDAALYDLHAEGPLLTPTPLRGDALRRFRRLSADELLFSRRAIRWADWAEAWERDRAGKGHKPPLARGVQLLPAGAAKGRRAARRR